MRSSRCGNAINNATRRRRSWRKNCKCDKSLERTEKTVKKSRQEVTKKREIWITCNFFSISIYVYFQFTCIFNLRAFFQFTCIFSIYVHFFSLRAFFRLQFFQNFFQAYFKLFFARLLWATKHLASKCADISLLHSMISIMGSMASQVFGWKE